MTNYEYMITMSVEKIAEWIYNHTYACVQCPVCIKCREGVKHGQLHPLPDYSKCCKRIAKWLNQEVVKDE